MTETKLAEPTEGKMPGEPITNRGQAVERHASSKLALHAGQDGWTDDQRAQLRSIGLEHATEADLGLLYHYAARTGLDPFTKQVYMVSRKTKIKVRITNPVTGNERVEEREVDKFTVQVGIDGWRVIGNRAARREHVRVGHDDVLWRGKGTGWQDYWDRDEAGGKPPVACKYTVEFDGTRVSATCSYAEYVQLVRDGGEYKPNSMWAKMPANQLAKCAEALAWRKAFPADYSGLVLEDAAQPVDVIDGEVVDAGPAPAKSAPPRKAAGASRNAQRAARARQEPEPAPVEEPSAERVALVEALAELCRSGEVDQFADVAMIVAELGGLAAVPAAAGEITDETLTVVVDKLRAIDAERKRPMVAELDDLFSRWLSRQPDEAGQ